MTNNELITELLKYDGFTKDIGNHSITYTSEIDSEGYRTVIGNEYAQTYLTDMNIIHRIAVKVFCDVLDCKNGTISDVNAVCENIKHEFINSPNSQGEHIQLATALVNAIKYIQNEPKK